MRAAWKASTVAANSLHMGETEVQVARRTVVPAQWPVARGQECARIPGLC